MAAVALCLHSAPAGAEPKQVACTTATADPRVTVDDRIDVALEGGTLQSLHWTVDRNEHDGRAVAHVFACELTIDASRFTIDRTRRGWLAVARDDRACRVQILGTGTHLALVPQCRSGCQAGGRYRSLAINVDSGLCRPLDDRSQGAGP